MTTRRHVLGIVAIAVIAIALVLLRHHFLGKPSSTSSADHSEFKPKTVATQITIDRSRENAARAIRAPAEPSTAAPRKPLEITHEATRKAAENPRSSSPAAATDPTPVKTPGELIARFTVDDPTQVFQPESVRYHEAVAAEAIDPDWGPIAESKMSTFLTDQLTPNWEYVLTDCRTDLCELNLVGPSTGSSQSFSAALAQMKQQPWWETLQFDQESGVVTFDGNQMVVIYFFSRK